MTASSAQEQAAARAVAQPLAHPLLLPQDDAPRTDGTPAPRFGGFVIAGMRLALPMAALREVVPCGPLTRLPCPAACVRGGIELRGVMVPVVDLRVVLGLPDADTDANTHTTPATPAASATGVFRSIIIMVHQGHILGLLADGVNGVFTSRCTAPRPDAPALLDDPAAALLSATVRCDDDGSLVSLLSPDAIASLPQLPRVADPEPGRQGLASSELPAHAQTDNAVPVMLMRCGQTALAIVAQAVHATLAAPQVERGVLSQGPCLGCIDYAGQNVPAIDLLSWCGLSDAPSAPDDRPRQAFVVSLDQGMVAFLIDSVIDVVRTQPADVVALPRFALPRAALFAGTLPLAALASEAALKAAASFGPHPPAHYLLLDAQALRTDTDVLGLSHTNTPGSSAALAADARSFAAGMAAGPGRRSLVTYALDHEAATPLSQLTEILPWSPELTRVHSSGPMRGILVNRGRSIAVLCLSQLVLGRPAELGPGSCLLVVAAQGELLGFAVPQLKTIEAADWEPELPGHAVGEQALPAAGGANSRKLALVGAGGQERMLPVIDLHALAHTLQARAA